LEIQNEMNEKWGNLSSYFDCHEQELISEYKWINEYWRQINYKYEMWNNYYLQNCYWKIQINTWKWKADIQFNSIFIYFSRLYRLLNGDITDIFQNKIKLNGSNGKVFILFLVYFIY